jgi:hypothetical protein
MTIAVTLKTGLRCLLAVPTGPRGGETVKSAALEKAMLKRSHVGTNSSVV